MREGFIRSHIRDWEMSLILVRGKEAFSGGIQLYLIWVMVKRGSMWHAKSYRMGIAGSWGRNRNLRRRIATQRRLGWLLGCHGRRGKCVGGMRVIIGVRQIVGGMRHT